MKTKIIALATLLLVTISIATADNHRTLKISDRLGRTMEILVKAESIFENSDINTSEIFKEMKKSETNQLIDLSEMIKPEKELNETLPVAK